MNSKDASKTEWDHAPDAWPRASLRRIARLQYGDSLADVEREDGQVLVYGSNGPVGYHNAANMLAPSIIVGRKGSFGKVTFAPAGGFAIDTTYFVDRTTCQHDLRWLFYGLTTLGLDQISQDTGVPGLSREKAYDARLAVPPLPIQEAIANYLDEKIADLDALIEKKCKLLDLLTEERAALINQAVTKGLDPNVPMKDSGIPWIGEIPAHWGVKRLRHISPQQSVGVVINPSTYVDEAGDIPFIYGGEVSEGEIAIVDARRITAQSNRLLRKSQLRAGDLVCVRVGDPGVTAVVPPALDGINCASVMIIRRAPTFSSGWLCYAMNSRAGRQNITLVAYGAAQKQFNIGHAVDFVYPVPPKTEQDVIVKWLDSTLAGVQETLTAIVSQIDRLQEYRQALITAAVTGQLDSGAAA